MSNAINKSSGETAKVYKTYASFQVSGVWVWYTFTSGHADKRAALIAKARELGAPFYDIYSASHRELPKPYWA